jgi:hypothetical protein
MDWKASTRAWGLKYKSVLGVITVLAQIMLSLATIQYPGLVGIGLVVGSLILCVLLVYLIWFAFSWPPLVKVMVTLLVLAISGFGIREIINPPSSTAANPLGLRRGKNGALNSPAMIHWPPLVVPDSRHRTVALYFALDNTTNETIHIVKIYRSDFANVSDDPENQAAEIKKLGSRVDNAMLAPTQPTPFPIPAFGHRYYIIDSPIVNQSDWSAYLAGKKAMYFYAEILVTMSDGTRTGFAKCGFDIKGITHQADCES